MATKTKNGKTNGVLLSDLKDAGGCLDAIAGVKAAVGGPQAPLSANERKHLLKPRDGAGLVVPQIAALAREAGLGGLELASIEAMEADFARAEALAEVDRHLGGLASSVRDARLQVNAAYWGHALALYAMLQRLARADATLAARLAPVQGYFQSKARRRDAKVTEAAPMSPKAVAPAP